MVRGESRLAIGVIGAMVEIDGEWTDAIAGKPAPTELALFINVRITGGSGLARDEALTA